MSIYPKISIILPTYNRANKIVIAVKGVIEQSFVDWELIIIDDTSTDDTPVVLEKIKQLDKRIKCLRNEENLGLVRTLNKGLAVSKGKYIARLDDDDEWIDKGKLQKQINYMESHPECVLLGSSFNIVNEDNSNVEVFNPPLDDRSIRNIILSHNPFGHSTVLFKKDVAVALGGYDENLDYTEDYDLWLRLGNKGKLGNLFDVTVKYIKSNHGMSYNNHQAQIRYQYDILKKNWQYYPGKSRAIINFFKIIFRMFFCI